MQKNVLGLDGSAPSQETRGLGAITLRSACEAFSQSGALVEGDITPVCDLAVVKVVEGLEKLEHDILRLAFAQATLRFTMARQICKQVAARAEFEEDVSADVS
jgi:hypothetical protein